MTSLTKKMTAVVGTALVFTTLAGYPGTVSAASKKAPAKTNKITVTYVLKKDKKTVGTKKVTLKKKSKVITGLKKAWKVKETGAGTSKGFVTAINGLKQNTVKNIYWTYTINGKFATKGVEQQIVKNKDKVTFTLAKYNG